MGEIVLGILGPVMQLGECIWTPVKRGMSYMVHYKRNLQSLGLQVEKLEAMRNGHKESGLEANSRPNMLALKLDETSEMARAARLTERIIRGKKILIILDDIWETIDLSTIGIPSREELGRCGSKVILTTRIFNVCHAMGSQLKIPLNRSSEEDSWNLFVEKAGKSFESTNFCEVAKQVASECGGLPVALITVASALGDKDQLEERQEAARDFPTCKSG